MNFSTAIRSGCEVSVQGFHKFFRGDNKCACVIGTAALGYLRNDPERKYEENPLMYVSRMSAELLSVSAHHPVITEKYMAIWTILVELNDDYMWTREKIADWLEGEGY